MLRASFFSSIASVFAPVLLCAVAACSSSSGPSLDPARSNCETVCNKAHDCGSSTLDEAKCADDCSTKSKNDTSYKDNITQCSDCVNDKECTEAGKCTGDCFNAIVKAP